MVGSSEKRIIPSSEELPLFFHASNPHGGGEKSIVDPLVIDNRPIPHFDTTPLGRRSSGGGGGAGGAAENHNPNGTTTGHAGQGPERVVATTGRGPRVADRHSGTSRSPIFPRNDGVDTDQYTAHKATTAAVQTGKVQPEARANTNNGSHSNSMASSSSSPQRRAASSVLGPPALGTNLPTAAPDNYHYWKQVPDIPPSALLTPVQPGSNNHPRPEKDEFSKASAGFKRPPVPPPPPPKSASSKTSDRPLDLRSPRKKPRSRSQAQRVMLGSALEMAHTAVTFDHAENYERALVSYQHACTLLTEVMERTGGDDDKIKLHSIKDTYMERINEIKALPASIYLFGRRVAANADVYLTTEQEEGNRLSPAASLQINVDSQSNGNVARSAVPHRRDSLHLGPESVVGGADRGQMLPLSQSGSEETMVPAPLSPTYPTSRREHLEPEPDGGFHKSFAGSRESHALPGSTLSPRFSPRKSAENNLRRSSSDASSRSSRSYHQGHSRQGSEELTTSWLNTIDESGSSVGEPSPKWTRKKASAPLQLVEKDEGLYTDDDFDTQLDIAVEAAYGDGYEVDYSDQEQEIMVLKSPRLDVELTKVHVRQVEREMELEVQKGRERREQRELMGAFGPKAEDPEPEIYEDADDESEEERMLDEMTRGYTLDFDFNLDSKTALPRGSTSTQSSDTPLTRGSMSSVYSQGTTWCSSMSSQLTTSTSLTTVTEAPNTLPILDFTSKLDESAPANIDVSPAKPPPPPPPLSISPTNNMLSVANIHPLTKKPPPILVPLSDRITPSINSTPLTNAPPESITSPLDTPLSSGLRVSKQPTSVRNRRLSALAEPLGPLKIDTPLASPTATSVPTAITQESTHHNEHPTAPAKDPPPIPQDPPFDGLPKTPRGLPASRPGTSNGQDADNGAALAIKGGKLMAPPNQLHGDTAGHNGLTSIPLQKTVSEDGFAVPRSGSPARIGYTPKVTGIPPLRQIQSSASLRTRNVASPEFDLPGTPMSTLFSSSSTSNLRKAVPRSSTPLHHQDPPATAGLGTNGMNLFDSRIHSPSAMNYAVDSTSAPVLLEPCPSEPTSKPFWLMRCLYQTIAHPRGGYISTRLFVPRDVWSIKGVKIKAIDDKISACDLVTAALQKLAEVKQDQINSIFEEMQALEGVLDRAQTMLSKKLGNEVGSAGAKALYGENLTSEGGHSHHHDMITTKVGNVSASGKGYFSLRKLRTKASNNGLNSTFSGHHHNNNDISYTSLPIAQPGSDSSKRPKRNVESVSFTGPNAAYISALAKLFDAAQILDQLLVFDEELMSKKVPIKLRIGLELSHRHAAEFFGFYICRFVLADVSLLLDKFVKRGSEWVSQ